MKKGGGSLKGGAFERQTAKTLSLWLSNGSDKDLLWRTASSGGRASTGKATTGFGDLGIDKDHPDARRFLKLFCVECKNYKTVSITKAFFNEKNDLWKWWDQAVTQAKGAGCCPMLIAKGDRQPTLLILPTELTYLITKIKFCMFTDSTLQSSVIAVDFNEFLVTHTWKDVYNTMKSFGGVK